MNCLYIKPTHTSRPLDKVLPAVYQIVAIVVSLVFMNAAQAITTKDKSLERAILNGMIDSSGDKAYWENRKRVSLPNVIITSETYLLYGHDESSTSAAAPTGPNVLDIVDVHRIQLVGSITSTDLERLNRIALTGTITSHEEWEIVNRYGLNGIISNENPQHFDTLAVGGENIELASLRSGGDDVVLFPGDSAPEATAELLAILSDTTTDNEYPTIADGNLLRARARAMIQMIAPTLTTYLRYDEIDEDSEKTRDTTLIVVQPRFRLALQQSNWSLVSHYLVESGKYISGDFENFLNHELSSNWEYSSSRKNQFNIEMMYRKWQNRRVDEAITDFNSGLVDSFSHDSLGFDFSWEHGTKKDRLRSVISANTTKTLVKSDEKGEFGYDVVQNRLAGTGFWRIRRKVTLLLDGLYQHYDYKDREDSDQFRLSAGADFWMLKRVTGRLQIGYQYKRFEDTGDEDSGLVWNADVTWRPKKTTTLSFNSARQLVETYFRSNTVQPTRFGVQQHAEVALAQRWSQAWDSNFSVTYLERDFQKSMEHEESLQLIFGTNYKITPRITLRGDGAYTTQQAKIANDYDRWTLTFYANMRL
jgi:hypothetical protein